MATPPRSIRRINPPEWPYTYDIDDKEFLEFFKRRRGIVIGQEDNLPLARFCLTDPRADEWIRNSKNYTYMSGKMVPFGQEREDAIRWHTIVREALQGYWEIYQKEKFGSGKIRRRINV